MDGGRELTRRALIGRGAVAGAGAMLGGIGAAGVARAAHSASSGVVPLPSPAQVRAEFTRMVEFGPRLTGSPSHAAYVDWMEQEFLAAGLQLRPCDGYTTSRWTMESFGLQVAGKPVDVATYYVRSQQTGPSGVTGPLVYGGVAPALSVNGADLATLQAAIAAYPAAFSSWASGISGAVGGVQGSIVLIDLPMPVPLTSAAFVELSTYLHWPGHTIADWATADYKRLWIEPGLGIPLAPWQQAGAAGVVFVVDSSWQALVGGYLPFTHGTEPLPALFVDRDTGLALRTAAAARPVARLTLTGTVKPTPVQSVTAVLPGESDETLIFNTHTDGQGFAEENGGVAFVELARHFASLPRRRRLKRTLVFAAWPGHMTWDLPQTQGWIDAHPDLVARAAAALTIEHLGCTEWIDSIDRGYHATGEPEMFGLWTTQGTMFKLVKASVIAHNLPRVAMLRPPVQFGVGAAFQSSGVPQIGAIAGPEYLVTVSDNGDLDKLDEHLAARQIRWLASLAHTLDGVSAADLRSGDPTLGVNNGNGASTATEETCT